MNSPGREPYRQPTPGPSVTSIVVSFGILLIALVLLVAHIASASASAAASTPLPASSTSLMPLSVQSASLTQNGQQLVWQLRMSQPFSPGALARDRRTLCLQLGAAAGPTVTGRLCVAGPRPGQSAPQITYAAVTKGVSGRATAIAATVTRGSNQDLTASFLPSAIAAAYKPLSWQVISTLGAPSCTAAGTAGNCQALFPSRPALLSLRAPQLVGCKATGGYVSRGPSNVRQVALTFDDGPGGSPPTMDFVNLLARYGVPGTFFEVGNQISRYDPTGKVQRVMLANGDMLADHSWSHADLAKLSASAQRSQIAMTAAAIKKSTGFQPCLFRAPYGSVNSSLIKVASSLGFSTIQWDVDPQDWALPGTSAIISRVLAGVRPGSIVLQHFAGGPRYQTLNALPTEIKTLKARGYKFVTVTQMLGYKLVYR